MSAVDTRAAIAADHEQLAVRRGRRSGATVVVAIHSTVLGPALGGARMWAYENQELAVEDALRLAHGMTHKAAAAGLGLGGGKGVICSPSAAESLDPTCRREMLLDFADLVESLDGRYVTAEDVGTGPEDMVAIAERTKHVTGLPPELGGSGDPSPFTALGVDAAIRACVAHRHGSSDLNGLHVVVIGLGHVGSRLTALLAEAGAQLTLADIDPRKRAIAERLGAQWAEPAEALVAECDVLAPCALGGAIDGSTVGRINAEIICGAANNQLADESLAERLAGAGVLYAPDFIANAGGLANVYREYRGLDEGWARAQALGIEAAMARILVTADELEITPQAAALEIACRRLARALRD